MFWTLKLPFPDGKEGSDGKGWGRMQRRRRLVARDDFCWRYYYYIGILPLFFILNIQHRVLPCLLSILGLSLSLRMETRIIHSSILNAELIHFPSLIPIVCSCFSGGMLLQDLGWERWGEKGRQGRAEVRERSTRGGMSTWDLFIRHEQTSDWVNECLSWE